MRKYQMYMLINEADRTVTISLPIQTFWIVDRRSISLSVTYILQLYNYLYLSLSIAVWATFLFLFIFCDQ